ncbi:alpha-mannosyltransferase [Corynebacterium sp. HMSC06D04]|uniref:Glycosyltransferase family 1 protein n=2 Tax=Corynebacterium TaxID=1716 RepID=A0A2A4ANV7_9CORY|nr:MULTISPECIES: glycosyltransferase family 1 protein [Corynebacterium]MDU3174593.1 glycosyltransferase family 1 protein [Corynebacterium striatum]PCC83940.1 glycosyltransferase family 1 protein [Corynebacterium accolens]AMO88750.1 GDP-mannose-dependent alpha-mannosyltransferase [Corynebacterium simulans]AMO91418.1 GDP-mannose-dependent alpha-mannosyltransferase [Corynebacterium simulans]KXU18802.1 GDP-mannose-dependent alpha-mannosyltransferase [Corynebacterium simulans]
MRVAIVAESFLPNVNGVTNSVLRVLEHLAETGHEALVIAPGAREGQEEIADYLGFPIVRVPTVRIPLIDSLPVGVPTTAVDEALRQFKPDIIHLASPFVLGAAGAFSARQQRIPSVALYQTDVAGFATKYHASALAYATWEWLRTIHNACQMTLAPSSLTIRDLEDHNIKNVRHWGRGVDAERFHPSKRSAQLRKQWGADGKKVVGFVGRLAAEKGVHRLAALNDRSDIQLVIVGDGPERPLLEAQLPNAYFTGALGGDELAQAYASLDVFVHAGEFETFCQAIQEAQASGVPTIGPRAGGPVDLIQEGYNGLLLEVATFVEDLPNAVDALLNPEIHEELRANARESISSKTWKALCEQLLGYYEEVLEDTRRVPLTILGQRPELPRWAARALGARVA